MYAVYMHTVDRRENNNLYTYAFFFLLTTSIWTSGTWNHNDASRPACCGISLRNLLWLLQCAFFSLKIPGRRGLQMNRYDWMEIRKLCWHNKMFQGFDAPAIFKRQTPPICHKSLRVNPRHKASIGRGVDLGNYPYQHNRSTIGCVSKCGKFSREDYD